MAAWVRVVVPSRVMEETALTVAVLAEAKMVETAPVRVVIYSVMDLVT